MCARSSDNALQTPDTGLQVPLSSLASPEAMTRLCGEIQPEQGVATLVAAINALMPGLPFDHVLSRGGWYRLGGVVDADHQRVSGNIAHWVEEECGGDVESLIARYAGSGYMATRVSGTIHFITAPRGPEAQDYIQIEIEELQEILDRPLVDRDWFPDSVEEFLEPIDYPRVAPEPVGKAYFQFRRITAVGDLLNSSVANRRIEGVQRFFSDWSASSAGEQARFCRHWVLALREYRDHEGLLQITGKPLATFGGELPALPGGAPKGGTELANAIHDYDRRMGYPFAWYFMMLAQKSGNHALAQAVLADHVGDYDYLAQRDLAVLRAWESWPYGV